MIADREAIVRLSLLFSELAQEVAFQATYPDIKVPTRAKRLMQEAAELRSRITDGHIIMPEEQNQPLAEIGCLRGIRR